MATELQSEAEVLDALKSRFPAPGWAMFSGVANGTGGRANRWADALAMSVWPSRGLELFGFEIKVDRGDLLRELKNPKKADAVGKFCDKWWIAAGSKTIAKPEELPPAWGLLVPHGGTMKIVKDAKSLDPEPLSRTFLAAILRRAAERFDIPRLREQIRHELHDEVYQEIKERCYDRWKGEIDDLKVREQREREQRIAMADSLRSATVSNYTPKIIGRAIDLLVSLEAYGGVEKSAENMLRAIERDKGNLDAIATTLRETQKLYAEIKPPKDDS